ncbi:PREDICTED: uncharacterized protein LOC109235842 [Nicotiana attenuata]|uniref:uncharacterized protein LOC109235842 n=1 Tax=Nicotiana attenuata TaxID=49451 RepID=UPI000904A4CE|nr:PREDICTED: uncharacterized protein LOC109235842 [Nicotiana attenuata]
MEFVALTEGRFYAIYQRVRSCLCSSSEGCPDYRTFSGTETVPTTTLYQASLQEFWLSQPDKTSRESFIVSEVMFFFALFRASSHSSLAPTVEIGGIWPPKGIAVLDPWEIPFLNTLIPLSSGAAVTWAHHAILAGKEKRAVSSYYGGYVFVAKMNEKRDERAIFKSIDR